MEVADDSNYNTQDGVGKRTQLNPTPITESKHGKLKVVANSNSNSNSTQLNTNKTMIHEVAVADSNSMVRQNIMIWK